MTNAEKFAEVFGFKPNSNLCYMPEDVICPEKTDCCDCPYELWLNEEYTGEFKHITESENAE